MTTHLPPFGWVAPGYEHAVEDEPDSVDATTRVGYDHIAGRVGSDVRIQLDGASGDTRAKHTVITSLRITEPDVRRIADAGKGFVGVTLRCQFADFTTAVDPEELSADFSARLSSVVSATFVLAPDKPLGTLQLAGPAVTPPELFAISSAAVGRSLKPIDKVETPAAEQDVRRLVFAFAGIDGWDRTSPLELDVTLTNALSVSSNDVSFTIFFRSHWQVDECVLNTANPYSAEVQGPGPNP